MTNDTYKLYCKKRTDGVETVDILDGKGNVKLSYKVGGKEFLEASDDKKQLEYMQEQLKKERPDFKYWIE